MDDNGKMCQHCHQRKVSYRARGLCYRCGASPKIKALYPCDAKPGPKKGTPGYERSIAAGRNRKVTHNQYTKDKPEDEGANMTLEELDRLIAERYPTMPEQHHQEPRHRGLTIRIYNPGQRGRRVIHVNRDR